MNTRMDIVCKVDDAVLDAIRPVVEIAPPLFRRNSKGRSRLPLLSSPFTHSYVFKPRNINEFQTNMSNETATNRPLVEQTKRTR